MPSRFTEPNALPIPRCSRAGADTAQNRHRLEAEVVALFDQFRGPLLRYLSNFGLSISDREEITQDVFLSLFEHLRQDKPRENLRGWLFRVAHNLGARRRHQTRREFESQTERGLKEPIDPSPDPEAQVAANRTQEVLLAVIHALPEQDRRCLFLRAEGLRYREISGILDMSLGSVSQSLTRSLARIATAVER
jgi:RNA polymerase sigma-70 factor (ECF subfamily)